MTQIHTSMRPWYRDERGGFSLKLNGTSFGELHSKFSKHADRAVELYFGQTVRHRSGYRISRVIALPDMANYSHESAISQSGIISKLSSRYYRLSRVLIAEQTTKSSAGARERERERTIGSFAAACPWKSIMFIRRVSLRYVNWYSHNRGQKNAHHVMAVTIRMDYRRLFTPYDFWTARWRFVRSIISSPHNAHSLVFHEYAIVASQCSVAILSKHVRIPLSRSYGKSIHRYVVLATASTTSCNTVNVMWYSILEHRRCCLQFPILGTIMLHINTQTHT